MAPEIKVTLLTVSDTHDAICISRYIEFYDAMSVPMAIALSGQLLLGQQVLVKPSEAEKNLIQSNTSLSAAASGGVRKLYVGNLHSNITEDQLRQVKNQTNYFIDIL